MTSAPVYGLSSHVSCQKSNSDLVTLIDRDRGVAYELNESASAIVAALSSGPKSRLDLVDRIATEFEGNGPDIEADLGDFLADFERAGLIARISLQPR
jgi:hypothetical protein